MSEQVPVVGCREERCLWVRGSEKWEYRPEIEWRAVVVVVMAVAVGLAHRDQKHPIALSAMAAPLFDFLLYAIASFLLFLLLSVNGVWFVSSLSYESKT